MKTIRKTTIRLPAPGDDFPMTYALCQDDDGAFAIALRNGHTGEQAVTQDITHDPVAALALYDLLVRGGVTPIRTSESCWLSSPGAWWPPPSRAGCRT